MGRTLIRGGSVLSLGARTQNFAEADVLIEGGLIVEVGTDLRSRAAEEVNATDTIVMPGLVDAHHHLSLSLFRGLDRSVKPDLPLGPEDVYAATLVGLLAAAEAGTTTVVDWADGSLGRDHTTATLRAHADSGLRTVFVLAGIDPVDLPAAFEHATVAVGPTTTIAYGSPDLDAANGPRVSSSWEVARRLGLRIHACAGTRPGESGVVAQASSMLGNDVTLIHCTHLDGADLDAIASTGTQVVLTPASDMTKGAGSPPVQQLIDRSIQVGLGVGDTLASPVDIFAQMRQVISLQHATYFDLKLAGKAGLPNLLTTREVIRYGTGNAARAAGLGSVVGSLEPGKQADILILRTDRPNIYPINDPIGAVVWGMDSANVEWLFVGGRPIVRRGELEADAGLVRRLVADAQHRLGTESGSFSTPGATA
ncbi:MAG: amidohydrolase family protein [Acidimicrobiia bacterium]|nr:amidohydrolase family protein [Acidimicrobiia bacterium]